jgi:flagellar biosynthesis protein FlhG
MLTIDHSPLELDKLFSMGETHAPERKKGPIILAIAGGKGGVGKSVVSLLLGIELGRMGHETILVDADFSGAHLHTLVHRSDPEKALRNYLEGRSRDINDLALQTPFKRLRFITGSPSLGAYNRVTLTAKQKLIGNLQWLQARYIVIDLGAGSTYGNLDFFLKADHPLVVASSDKHSLHDAYGLIRTALVRNLQKNAYQWPELFHGFQKCGDLTKGIEILTVNTFLHEHANDESRICEFIRKQIGLFRPALILNKLQKNDDRERAKMLPLITKIVLNVNLEAWGEIRHDPQIKKATSNANSELLIKGCAAGKDLALILQKKLSL